MINAMYTDVSLQRIVSSLGREVQTHVNYERFRKSEPKLVNTIQARLSTGHQGHLHAAWTKNLHGHSDKYKMIDWSEGDMTHVGMVLFYTRNRRLKKYGRNTAP